MIMFSFSLESISFNNITKQGEQIRNKQINKYCQNNKILTYLCDENEIKTFISIYNDKIFHFCSPLHIKTNVQVMYATNTIKCGQ